jgi:hypothetical protein
LDSGIPYTAAVLEKMNLFTPLRSAAEDSRYCGYCWHNIRGLSTDLEQRSMREMEHRFAAEPLKSRFQRRGIRQVTDDQFLIMYKRIGKTGRKVIEHHNLVTRLGKLSHNVAANIAGPAGHENIHARNPLLNNKFKFAFQTLTSFSQLLFSRYQSTVRRNPSSSPTSGVHPNNLAAFPMSAHVAFMSALARAVLIYDCLLAEVLLYFPNDLIHRYGFCRLPSL